MNSIAVYYPEISIDHNILQSLKTKYQNYDDFLVFSDVFYASNNCQDFGIMSTFYMKFFKGKVIFLNNEDYNKNKDNILGEAVLYELQ
jgi:hypothetical protein